MGFSEIHKEKIVLVQNSEIEKLEFLSLVMHAARPPLGYQ